MTTPLRVGIVGTGAIAHMHARAYKNIGYSIRACTNVTQDKGRTFAALHGAEFFERYEDVCRHPEVDVVDVCTFPSFRLDVVHECAASRKPVQVQKPIATTLDVAREMIDVARSAGIVLGVVSQHRFDRASQFLKTAIQAGRLGRLLQCDAYVKWWRSDEYYARPVKGSWKTEGGGALINQAIHQVDLLLWFAGPVREVFGMWQLGAAHQIESEDIVNAVVRYESGATGVVQATTAVRPGYSERLELHGTRGSAIVTGDQLTTWDVADDGEMPPLAASVASGSSDPMAISVESFERQFLDFGDAIAQRRAPLVSGEEGYRALEAVDAIYRSCRTGQRIAL
jgi:UDP-N-acetyl-2-amino-2-deoxyglucuronate dehydrogenase